MSISECRELGKSFAAGKRGSFPDGGPRALPWAEVFHPVGVRGAVSDLPSSICHLPSTDGRRGQRGGAAELVPPDAGGGLPSIGPAGMRPPDRFIEAQMRLLDWAGWRSGSNRCAEASSGRGRLRVSRPEITDAAALGVEDVPLDVAFGGKFGAREKLATFQKRSANGVEFLKPKGGAGAVEKKLSTAQSSCRFTKSSSPGKPGSLTGTGSAASSQKRMQPSDASRTKPSEASAVRSSQ